MSVYVVYSCGPKQEPCISWYCEWPICKACGCYETQVLLKEFTGKPEERMETNERAKAWIQRLKHNTR